MSGDHRLNLALSHHDAGRYTQAIDILTQLLADNPDEALYHGLLASCLLARKRLTAAEYELDIALGQAPNVPYLHLVRARLLLVKRKVDDAITACDDALALDPQLVDAWLVKASLLMTAERATDSRACLDEAARLAPSDIAVVVGLGDYCNWRGDHKEALQHATEALRINAGSEAANLLMGETQLALGNEPEAEYHAKFAITQNPNSQSALRLFVNIRMRRNLFIGVWWRFNHWIAGLGTQKSALVLIAGFLAFNMASQIAADLGYAGAAATLSYAWLLLVIYSWVGIPMYHKALEKELASFSFNPRF